MSSLNKSLKHKVVGCFLVHFILVSGCIGVGGVDGGVVLVMVLVVVVVTFDSRCIVFQRIGSL